MSKNVSFLCSYLPYTFDYVIYWGTLIFTLARTLSSQFLAAQIHDASNYPLNILKAVPEKGWCIEVQRFIDQIRSQTIALSGWKFFYLTKDTLLTVK